MTAKPASTIEKFAERYRLKIRRDECGDPVIPGRRGHLYFDGAQLCAMGLNAPVMRSRRLQALGGECWIGDFSRLPGGKRVMDYEIRGIPPENWPQAIRLVNCRAKRILSQVELEQRRASMERVNTAKKGLLSRQERSPATADSPASPRVTPPALEREKNSGKEASLTPGSP